MAVIGGVLTTGSPGAARTRSLDLRRVDDLKQIASAIDGFWDRHQALPALLVELEADRDTWLQSIHDPETNRPYEYRTSSETAYELCATFEASSNRTDQRSAPEQPAFWSLGEARSASMSR